MWCDPAHKHVVICVYREWLVMSRIVGIGSREHGLFMDYSYTAFMDKGQVDVRGQ